MITIILRTKNRIRHRINALLFIYGIGTLGKQYDAIKSVIDRMAFAAEKFGHTFPQVIQERVWYTNKN